MQQLGQPAAAAVALALSGGERRRFGLPARQRRGAGDVRSRGRGRAFGALLQSCAARRRLHRCGGVRVSWRFRARAGAGDGGGSRRAGSAASMPRPWRATMRLSSASASIWSTMTRRICAALSAVSCGSSRMPRRSSVRVVSSSRCISAAICRMPWSSSVKRCVVAA